MDAINSTDALGLLGKTLDLCECLPGLYGPDFAAYRATVMAVQVPAPGSGIEWSLLLHQEGFPPDHLEYVELDRLRLALTQLEPGSSSSV